MYGNPRGAGCGQRARPQTHHCWELLYHTREGGGCSSVLPRRVTLGEQGGGTERAQSEEMMCDDGEYIVTQLFLF